MNNPALINIKHSTEEKPGDGKVLALTTREQEIQRLITTGMTNKMIAGELGICEGTVKIHVKNLMRKLRVRSRLEVALMALGVIMNKQYGLRSRDNE